MARFCLTFLLLITVISSFPQHYKHDVKAEVNIEEKSIQVTDVFSISDTVNPLPFYLIFKLSKDLTFESMRGINYNLALVDVSNEKFNVYRINFIEILSNTLTVELTYSGIIEGSLEKNPFDYSRGFSQTDGIITDDGVYLAGSTFWIPDFDTLFVFRMQVNISQEYGVVSQGKMIENFSDNILRTVTYECPYPMEEIYLIASRWTTYEKKRGDVLIQAFLRKSDDDLANRYLNVTSDYLALFEGLIGPYPYSKFALVENFWETGYGMPSFTLLGEKVIRFPWILHSSYPHELLHNYWGNSVYVDYSKGNWCEGITSYMADHLIKEKSGEGSEYRRNTLQRYSDFVNAKNDLPLSSFINRNSPAEEAVGYGKCLMMNHMLRLKFGDEIFIQAYADFYKEHIFTKASFDDIRQSFENLTGTELKPFFEQWVDQTGAPELKLGKVLVGKEADTFLLRFELSQIQEKPVFALDIPVAVYPENEEEVSMHWVQLNERKSEYVIKLTQKPLKIEIDPEFDIFRKLDKREVPATLSRMYGSDYIIIVTPRADPQRYFYEELAKEWKTSFENEGKKVDIINDRDLNNIPKSNAIWILGDKNSFLVYSQFNKKQFEALDTSTLTKWNHIKENGCLVYTFSNPENANQTFGFLRIDNHESIKTLISRLPHYGKYSYVGFEGKHTLNTLKGIFEVFDSPMSYTMTYNGQKPMIKAKLRIRKALGN